MRKHRKIVLGIIIVIFILSVLFIMLQKNKTENNLLLNEPQLSDQVAGDNISESENTMNYDGMEGVSYNIYDRADYYRPDEKVTVIEAQLLNNGENVTAAFDEYMNMVSSNAISNNEIPVGINHEIKGSSFTAVTYKAIALTNVYTRMEPSTTAEKGTFTVKKGQTVDVIAENQEWFQIFYNGETSYSSRRAFSKVNQ